MEGRTSHVRAIRGALWLVALLAVVVGVAVRGQGTAAVSPATYLPLITRAGLGGQIHGFVAASINRQEGKSDQIRLPNARVFVRNQKSGDVSPSVITNPHGYFIIPKQPSGTYTLCVEASGFTSNCERTPISIGNETVILDHDPLVVPIPGVLQGQVLLKDGRFCYQENSFFATLTTTTVALLASGGTPIVGPVLANSRGEYVLPKIPAPGSYFLTAACNGAKITIPVTLTASDLTGSVSFNLNLGNSSPQIVSLVPTVSGKAVRSAAPGDVVKVTIAAHDPDGNSLHYKWGDGSTGFTSIDAPSIDWHLSNASATNILFVQITDNLGGYAYDRLRIQTGEAGVLLAGIVSDKISSAPLANATVSVNGMVVKTNGNGAFQATVPETPRYVLNVRKPGYALLSQVFYAGTTGLKLNLEPARRQVCDPTAVCVVLEERQKTFSRVVIQPNTLVDPQGNLATTPLNVDIHGYDLSQPNPIPGDLSAVDTGGRGGAMLPFAAASIDITDASGRRYNLAPGKTAQLTMKVSPAQLAAGPPPATIPLWEYDEPAGIWKQKANATFNAGTASYDGAIPSFSQWNADTIFSNTACIKFTMSDPTLTSAPPPFPFILHVSLPSPFAVNHNDFPITENVNILYRLPPNQPVTLEIHSGSGPDVVLKSITVDSGNTINPTFDGPPYNGIPPFPYNDCHGFDPSSTLPGRPVKLALDIPPHEVPYLGVPGTPPSEPETNSYYTTVGALGGTTRDTFNHWKTTNGFNTNPNILVAGEANGIYYNNGDLQFGRDMHCLQNGVKVACYVTNYGTGPGGPDQLAIHDAIHKTSPIATVAMEYDPSLGINAVRFYAYHADLPNFDGTLFKNPALDSEGPKFLPQLCIACHGGSYNGSTHNVEGASFLPFDVLGSNFLYDTGPDNYSLANQQGQFRALNHIVKETHPNSTNINNPIVQLINGLYPCGSPEGGCDASDTPTPFTPPGWAGHEALYQTIPRVYCRTCHVAQPSFRDWTSYADFSSSPAFIKSIVCVTRGMPHAEIPFKKFWLSTNPHAPAYLSGSTGLNFGACPP